MRNMAKRAQKRRGPARSDQVMEELPTEAPQTQPSWLQTLGEWLKRSSAGNKQSIAAAAQD